MAQDHVLTSAEVHAFAREVLLALGMPEEDATIVADSMLWNALRGRINHSLVRLGTIESRWRGGGMSLTTDWTPVREHGVMTLLDGGDTWGPLAGARGMRYAISKAKKFGVGITSVRNCDNTSALSWFTSRALEEQLIGLALSNGAPLMTVWGAAEKMMNNAPLSFAVPARKRAPFMLDQAFGAVRLNVPRIAEAEGTQLPAGVVVDADGAPTTDPKTYLDGGSLLPVGGHRGSGVALMSEMLTAVLSGGPFLTQLPVDSKPEVKARNSLYLMAMDPGGILPKQEFLDRVDEFIDLIHAAKPAPGVDRVRVPGDEREDLAAERTRGGIPFPDEHVTKLRSLAADVGVRWPG